MRRSIILVILVILGTATGTALSLQDIQVSEGTSLWMEQNASIDMLCDTLDTSSYQVCYISWDEVLEARNDTQDITVNGSRSAFSLRAQNRLQVEIGTVDAYYSPDDEIDVRGSVTSPDASQLANATVQATIPDTGVGVGTTTDTNGRFQASLPVPNPAGVYHVEVRAIREPYRAGTDIHPFTVRREAELDVMLPDTVTAVPNSSERFLFFLRNTGFDTASNLRAEYEGRFETDTEFGDTMIQPNRGINVSAVLTVPADIDDGTYPLNVTILYGDKRVTDTVRVDVTEGGTTTPSGMLTLSPSEMDIDLPSSPLILFAVILGAGVLLYYRRDSRPAADRLDSLQGRLADGSAATDEGTGYSWESGQGREGIREKTRRIREELEDTMFG